MEGRISSMTGVAASCRSICQGTGCPSAASADPCTRKHCAREQSTGGHRDTAVKREKNFICRSAPCF